jgi:hypothetical protein
MSNDNSSKNVVAVFDLTTTAGVVRALEVADHPDFFSRLYGPIVEFAKEMVDKGLELFRTATDTEATINEQREAAVAVIMAGKEAGCSSIEITMDEEAGAKLGGKFGPNIDLTIISAGKTGKMTIKAEYK